MPLSDKVTGSNELGEYYKEDYKEPWFYLGVVVSIIPTYWSEHRLTIDRVVL